MANEQGRVVGWGTCKWCGLEDQPIKASKKEHLYFICAAEADGGCNHQHFSRGAVSDQSLARQVTRWKSKEERKKWLQDEPEPADEPADDPQAEPEGEPEPEAEEPPPPPKPKRRVAPQQPQPKPKRPQPPQLAKAKPKKILGGLLEW
jgi:hypothetical protein